MDKTIEICCHRINFCYFDWEGKEVPECEEEHVKQMICEGYVEGELNYLDPDGDTEHRGWWSILPLLNNL